MILTNNSLCKPKFDVAGVFFVCQGEFLLLQRQIGKPYELTFGVPGGKFNAGEFPHNAGRRELREETGIDCTNLSFFRTVPVRYPEVDFLYHMFAVEVAQKPPIILNPLEHVLATWKKPYEALQLPLIPDEDACIKMFFGL